MLLVMQAGSVKDDMISGDIILFLRDPAFFVSLLFWPKCKRI